MQLAQALVRWGSVSLLAALVCAGAARGEEERAPGEAATPDAPYRRSVERYPLPPVALTDQDGRSVTLSEVLPRDATVALNFIFTSCKTICPAMSRTVGVLRQRMGGKAELVQAVSISIDPAVDTPERLRAYAARLGAQAGWRFYTGDPADVEAVRKAFQVSSEQPTQHRPITLLRAANREDWVRIEGVLSTEELVDELKRLRSTARAALGNGPAASP